MLVDEDRADHIDLNFGCPVPKVTRKGGGSALPWKRGPLPPRSSRRPSGSAQGDVPLTVKMRKGIDADHLTYLEAGRIAEAAGVGRRRAARAHRRRVLLRPADWSAIARLKEAVHDVPVLGNGDIWSADDALRMVARDRLRRRGRGPRLPGPAVAVRRPRRRLLDGRDGRTSGSARRSAASSTRLRRHAGAARRALRGDSRTQQRACRDIRKHMAWYFKGYVVGWRPVPHSGWSSRWPGSTRSSSSSTPTSRIPGAAAEGPRGRPCRPKRRPCPRAGSTAASSTRDWPRT